jgi:hypothetical protein
MTEGLRSGAQSGVFYPQVATLGLERLAGFLDPQQHGTVHLLGGYQKPNRHILADVCEVDERRDTAAAFTGFGGLGHGSPYRTCLAVVPFRECAR